MCGKRRIASAPELEDWRPAPRAQARELYTFVELFGFVAAGGATSVNLGFLAPGRLTAKTPIYRYWISLDFLGFSRPNRDLSMGLNAIFAERIFPRAFPLSFEAREREPTVLVIRKRRIAHGAKLNLTSDYPQAFVGSSRPGSELNQFDPFRDPEPDVSTSARKAGTRNNTTAA
jgi:hypothetical protein